MLEKLPNEILIEVFSHLTLREVYEVRGVCKLWKKFCHLSIVFNIQKNDSKLHICSSSKLNKDRMMDLSYSTYIPSLDMIEFKSVESKYHKEEQEQEQVQETVNSIKSYQFRSDIHGLRMVFGPWNLNKELSPSFKNLNQGQRAHYLFHGQYKPIHQRLYLLPHASDVDHNQFWIGDASIGALILLERVSISDEEYCFQVKLARVSIPWIISGYDGPTPRYYKSTELKYILEKQANKNKQDNSEENNDYHDTDTRYILRNHLGTLLKDDPHTVFIDDSFIELHQDSALYRWRSLHSKLLNRRCDPLVIWKYNFVKEYILGKPTNDTLDIILAKIQNGELEWNNAKPDIIKLMNQSFFRSKFNGNNTLQSKLASLFISKKN
ncbi:hypothetical protein BJ944DRAFT_261967 [Cunninghamella echinulata]|nr:hypothetical protein BJ944DRAFT_261967 [Cunninghamella echinulata]